MPINAVLHLTSEIIAVGPRSFGCDNQSSLHSAAVGHSLFLDERNAELTEAFLRVSYQSSNGVAGIQNVVVWKLKRVELVDKGFVGSTTQPLKASATLYS